MPSRAHMAVVSTTAEAVLLAGKGGSKTEYLVRHVTVFQQSGTGDVTVRLYRGATVYWEKIYSSLAAPAEQSDILPAGAVFVLEDQDDQIRVLTSSGTVRATAHYLEDQRGTE